MHKYIVTVTAADRVGIVFSVAGTLRDQGGNILELSQTVMRGYFTIILAVEFAEPKDPQTARRGDHRAGQAVRPDGRGHRGRGPDAEAAGARRRAVHPDGAGRRSPGQHPRDRRLPGRARGEHRRPARPGRRRAVLAGHGGVPAPRPLARRRSAPSSSGSAATSGSRPTSSTRTSSWPPASRAPSASGRPSEPEGDAVAPH